MAQESPEVLASRIQAQAIDRQVNFSFLLKDFEKIFDMYIYSHGERSEATRMFVMLCTAPFLLLSLFGIAGDIELKGNTLIEVIRQFPSFMFLIFSVFGFAGIVPFHRFVAAHSNTYKMIRYMNGYRLFYYQLIKDDIDAYRWRLAIEKDPRKPLPVIASPHWTTGFSVAMFLLNTAYVCVGLWLWDGQTSNILMIALALIMIIIHGALAKEELHADDVDRLAKLNLPVDEILKTVDSEVE